VLRRLHTVEGQFRQEPQKTTTPRALQIQILSPKLDRSVLRPRGTTRRIGTPAYPHYKRSLPSARIRGIWNPCRQYVKASCEHLHPACSSELQLVAYEYSKDIVVSVAIRRFLCYPFPVRHSELRLRVFCNEIIVLTTPWVASSRCPRTCEVLCNIPPCVTKKTGGPETARQQKRAITVRLRRS
jgi:hypothetical protein